MNTKMLLPTQNNCPHCGLNLVGGLIADVVGVEAAKSYAGTHWRKEIRHEVWGIYDGTLYYECPECNGTWQRWALGTGLHEKAAPYMRRGRIVVEINYNVPKED